MKLLIKLRSFYRESVRVFKLTRKPTIEEFKIIVKITGIGIMIIGFLGFIIEMIWRIIK